jgi:hypothetical protein
MQLEPNKKRRIKIFMAGHTINNKRNFVNNNNRKKKLATKQL